MFDDKEIRVPELFVVGAELEGELEQCALCLVTDLLPSLGSTFLWVGSRVEADGVAEGLVEVEMELLLLETLSRVGFSLNVDVLEAHQVLGEGPRLIRADIRGSSHRFAALDSLHEVILVLHLVDAEGQRDADGQRES